jgi:DtxR family transcriptional regulator, Mn-dependent transcriptional regulator
MATTLTQAVEDYLKVIYDLTCCERRASTTEIASRMGVTPASATGMIQRMAEYDPRLVDYQKHRGVALTLQGERLAIEIIRQHRLLETFLQRSLGYTWDEVHAEADRLEHVVSPAFVERIALALGDPLVDPHGEPIPTRELALPPPSGRLLSGVLSGQQVTVQRILSPTPELLRYLGENGLVPGASLTVLEVSPFDDALRLQVDGQPAPLVLGTRVTNLIMVDQVEILSDPPDSLAL